MTAGLESFVGRDDELAALRRGVRDAREGHGNVWFVCGEAGIGKSRLVEELARSSGPHQAIAWGRCWEEGGAPPYWPWTQVLRTILRKRDVGLEPFVAAGRGPWLTQLVPELGDRVSERPAALEPALARFRLLDAAVSTLCDAAERVPLLLILEDLHVADASSIELLQFLARQIRAARIAVVATVREPDVRRSATFAAIERLRREARDLSLPRLGRAAVSDFLADALGRVPSPELVSAMFEATEGNPLFLSEIARRRVGLADSERRGGAIVIPESVQTAITERIADLSEGTRGLLATASALGRELSGAALAEVHETPRSELTRALAEAVDRAVLVEVEPDRFRFSHILVRDTLHQTLGEEHRRALHRRMAVVLERDGTGRWPQIAHHFVAAGLGSRDDAVRALGYAATESTSRLAFTEAASFLEQALGLLDGSERDRERCELLLQLASALHHAGTVGAARNECEKALDVARRLDEPNLFALAALEYGAVLEAGAVSDPLIALLEEALDRLEPGESAIRARVMSRLAAARQPAAPPEPQFELARRGIAMARRTGDDRALLDALRTGISALMDLADPRERLALNREHAELAERLGEPLGVLQANCRMVFDAAELGDLATGNAAIETCARIVDDLDLDQQRWRVSVMRAMCAMFEGRFADAASHVEAAREQAVRASEPWAPRVVLMQQFQLARMQGRWDAALSILDRADPLLHPFPFGRSIASAMRAGLLAEAGRRDAAAAVWREELLDWPLALGDLSMLEISAEAVAVVGSHDQADQVLRRLRPESHRFMSWGILAATLGPPAGAPVGRLLVALGNLRDGEQYLREALARARAVRALPHVARISLHIAALPSVRDAAERATEALDLAESLDMPGIAAHARERLDALGAGGARAERDAPVPSIGYFEMRQEGGVWVIACDGETFHVKDLKGLHLLSRLVESRGHELHVLDLESPTGVGLPDAGDAGETIDAEARAAYRRRVEELREDLEEAERCNDTGRAERAAAELEAIESELARALGLGGRSRRSASQVERARINVQRRLKDAIRRIEAQHAALGKHLEWAVRTGTFCSYAP